MISYKPFLKILIDRDIRKTDIIKSVEISSSTMAKFKTNEFISLEIIDKLCKFLECQPGDLIEYLPDSDTNNKKGKHD